MGLSLRGASWRDLSCCMFACGKQVAMLYSRISVSSPKSRAAGRKSLSEPPRLCPPPRGMPWGRCPLPGLLPQELRLGSTDLKHHKVWSREKNPRSRAGMCPLQRLLCAAASTVPEHGAAGTFVHQRHGHSRAKKIEFCFFFFFAPRATCTASDSHSPASNRDNVLVSWCPLCRSSSLTLLILQKKRRWKLVEKLRALPSSRLQEMPLV